MDNRRDLEAILAKLEHELRQLEIKYEQYFAGIEKREPIKNRELIGNLLRKVATRHITQTDVRFRFQNLASRFQSYSNHWDRILRLMDEGRFSRGAGRIPPPPTAPAAGGENPPPSPVDTVFRDLLRAHSDCGLSSKPPGREQVEKFLQTQREKIREKFGNRPIEFFVVTEEGRPKIKVRPQKGA